MRALHVSKTIFVFILFFSAQTTFAQKLSTSDLMAYKALLEPVTTAPLLTNSEASFTGGNQNLPTFIKKNLQYPSLARDYGIEGLVQVRFLVDVDGSIKNAKIVRRLGFDCDQAVLDLLNKMPRWLPEIKNGITQPSYHLLQVQFSL